VLQAIVEQQHVHAGVGHQHGLRAQRAVRIDPDRHVGGARDQQRFVAHLAGLRGGFHAARMLQRHAIAARDHAGPQPRFGQRARQRDHGRCLAGAAHGDIADHDHRHRQSGRFEPAVEIAVPAHPGDQAEQQRGRPHQPREPAAALPLGGDEVGYGVSGSGHAGGGGDDRADGNRRWRTGWRAIDRHADIMGIARRTPQARCGWYTSGPAPFGRGPPGIPGQVSVAACSAWRRSGATGRPHVRPPSH
jgi:hypothetical protein